TNVLKLQYSVRCRKRSPSPRLPNPAAVTKPRRNRSIAATPLAYPGAMRLRVLILLMLTSLLPAAGSATTGSASALASPTTAQQVGQLSASRVESIGAAAGARLRADGINLDLAPVADVPDGAADFIWQQHRAFSTSRYVVARDASAFAEGLESGQVWPTLKHF